MHNDSNCINSTILTNLSTGRLIAAAAAAYILTEYSFDQLKDAPLVIDAIYKGGTTGTLKDDVLHKLLPRTNNQGGFRYTRVEGSKSDFAYIVIYTSLSEIEWPDYFDVETGLFRYYGDNRKPGKDLHDTPKKGNLILKQLFEWLHNPNQLHRIPPILVFKKEYGRNVRFLGLAAPGAEKLGSNKDLISFWRSINDERFQNYESYFTILNTKDEPISKEWLIARINGDPNSDELAPKAWKRFKEKGLDGGYTPLASPRLPYWPPIDEQLPQDEEGKLILKKIYERYPKPVAQNFEYCATKIVEYMDSNFVRFDLTRPWRDGGRDAIGMYQIGHGHGSIKIECALEAKCYNEGNGITVDKMSRLISRIRYRQFGIFVTTSYIAKQAYLEVKEDAHPIIMITGRNIVEILKAKQIGINEIDDWLDSLAEEHPTGELR